MEAALGLVRPLCVRLVQSPSAELVRALRTAIQSFDSGVAQAMHQFLIFPLRTVLMQCVSQALPQQVLIETCQSLEVLLSKSQLGQPAVFLDLFSILSNLMFFDNSSGLAPRCLSEEERQAVVEALCALITRSDTEVLHEIYLAANIARLGSLVSQLVSMATDTKGSRSLRTHAMDTLLVLLRKRTFKKPSDGWQLGSRFAGVLPGMSTAMLRVLTGDSKQGHQLFTKALEVWTEVVCLTLADDSLAQEKQAGYDWIDGLQMSGRLKELVVRRDQRWVQTVAPRVEFMAGEITKLKKNHNWRVRLGLVHWATRLLSTCAVTLHSCLSPILQVLVLLMTDDYSQVAAPATAALQDYRDRQSTATGGSQPLVELLKENLFSLVTSLPRRITMEDEEEKVAVVGLLNGYISMLGSNMSALLLSLPHVTRLSRVLTQVLQLDVSDQKILEESGMGAKGSTNLSQFVQRVNVMTPRKVFTFFRDDKVKSELFRTCRLLGFYGDLSILVECFLDAYRESGAHQLPCVLIVNQVLAGHAQRGTLEGDTAVEREREDVVRTLLEEYLSYDNMTLTEVEAQALVPVLSPSWSSWPGGLQWREGEDEGVRRMGATRNRAVMLTCLLLEGVAGCAKVMGRRFRRMLMEALYPVAEKMGSEVSAVSSTAYLTLGAMAQACGYSSVDELIQSNADYLVNSISLRLRHFQRHQRAPRVLSVMLQLCTTDILPLVWDSIVEILDTLDEHHSEQAVVFLPVLYQLTLAVARWFPSQGEPTPAQSATSGGGPQPAPVVKFLVDRHRQRLEAEAFDAPTSPLEPGAIHQEAAKLAEEEENGEEEEEEEKKKKKEPPQHVKAVKEVLLRAKHLVSSADPRLTLLALDIIHQGCSDLADHENELLPIVHQLWQPLAQRLQDKEKVVVIKAVRTLQGLCECCGDFVRQRVEKGVLPTLRQFLHKQAEISLRSGSSYHYTVNFKLQLALLTALGDMALRMGLDGSGLEEVLYSCLPYLSQHQPLKLQQACVESVKKLMACDADVVWLALSGLYLPAAITPPSLRFTPVTVFDAVGEANDFSSNVTRLQQHMSCR